MSNEYPKALYMGSQAEHEMITVDGLEEEIKQREAGYVDFAELPEIESRLASGSIGEVSDKTPSYSQLEQELEQTLQEFDAFKNDVPAMQARIAEIQGDVYLGQSFEVGAEPTPNYENLTSAELKTLLKERGITYKVNDTKAELIALLG